MSKINPIIENMTGLQASINLNEAIVDVETDATLTGDGINTDLAVANPVSVSQINKINDTALHGIDNLGTDNLITVNADPSKYDVAAFDYYIDGTKYSFAGQTGIATGFTAGDDFMVVGVNAAGLIANPKDVFFTPDDMQTILEIGGMATADGTNIVIIGNSYMRLNSSEKDIHVWSKFAKKTNYLGFAGSISESSTALQLDVANGYIIDPDMNLEVIAAETDIGMAAYYRESGSYEIQPKVTPFIVDNLRYDDGTDLATLGNNKWASHTIARSSRTGTYYFIYSDGEFANEASAVDAPYSLGGFGTEIGSEVEPLAKVIIQKSAANINRIIDIRNLTSTVVSASTSTMQTTYDRSTQPQIVLDAGKPLEVRNDAGDTNTIIEKWADNAGVSFFEVTKDGVKWRTTTVTTTSTLSTQNKLVFANASSGNIDLTLPTAVGRLGIPLTIIRTDTTTNVLKIIGDGSETISGVSDGTLDSNESLVLESDGLNWFIV